jgi:hypothetical protein
VTIVPAVTLRDGNAPQSEERRKIIPGQPGNEYKLFLDDLEENDRIEMLDALQAKPIGGRTMLIETEMKPDVAASLDEIAHVIGNSGWSSMPFDLADRWGSDGLNNIARAITGGLSEIADAIRESATAAKTAA